MVQSEITVNEDTMERLVEEIDSFLSRCATRSLFSTDEILDLLLDLRMLIQSDPVQN
jgi:hypothetical protein